MGEITNIDYWKLIHKCLRSLICFAGISLICSCGNDHQKKVAEKKDTTIKKQKAVQIPRIDHRTPLGFKIVGYIAEARKPEEIDEQKFAQCNVVIYSAAKLLPDNEFKISFPENLQSIVDRAHRNHSRALLGISGAPSQFKGMTANAASRARCIAQIMQTVQRYNADGVDLDWEFPTIREKTDRPFTIFLKQLGDSCHFNNRYYLSCAIAPGINKVKRASAIRKELLTGNWVDWFNVMIYDYFSETRPYIQHSKIAYNSFYYWLRVRKMKREKCVMGIPLYGRPSGIPQANHVLSFKSILARGGSAYGDSAVIKTQMPISKKDTSRQYVIYYDGIKTVRKKTIGAKRYGGGVMFWELGYDTSNKYSLVATAVRASEGPIKKQ
jgi:GH18 family chitinase